MRKTKTKAETPWYVCFFLATGKRIDKYNPKDSPEYIAIFGESENSKRTATPHPQHEPI